MRNDYPLAFGKGEQDCGAQFAGESGGTEAGFHLLKCHLCIAVLGACAIEHVPGGG